MRLIVFSLIFIFFKVLTSTLYSFYIHTSQIYKFHRFIPNPCEICYCVDSYHLNTNVMHYLDTEVMCTTFMCKKTWIDIQHPCLFHTNLWKENFTWLLLPNCDLDEVCDACNNNNNVTFFGFVMILHQLLNSDLKIILLE